MASRSLQARRVLRINGMVSGIFGLVVLSAAKPLAEAFGLASAAPVALVGLGVAFLGADALLVSLRRGLRKLHLLPFATIASATVAVSVAGLLAAGAQITLVGESLLIAVAVVAAAFAVFEFRAARDL